MGSDTASPTRLLYRIDAEPPAEGFVLGDAGPPVAAVAAKAPA